MKQAIQPQRSTDPNKALKYQLELHLNNQRQLYKQVMVPSETEGRLVASLEILRMIYKEQDPLWLDLVETMSSKIEQDRLKRGAGPKPVLKPYQS